MRRNWRKSRRRGLLVLALVCVCALGLAAALGGWLSGGEHPGMALTGAPISGSGGATPFPGQGTKHPQHPNIVFVLTDDLSMDLLQYMPQVRALQAQGMTFEDYFVSDSLCCPSRASIFTGDFPHDTGVYNNVGKQGGIGGFFRHGDETHTFNLALQQAGYRTAMMGKYLNGYLTKHSPLPARTVPPGWTQWDVAGDGYPEFDYDLDVNGKVRHYGDEPGDYLTDVLSRRAVSFIDGSARARNPFFLELATFAPHRPYVPAPRDANLFPDLTAPEPPNFDTLPTDPPSWLASHQPLSIGQIREIDEVFRLRAQSVQAIDDLLSHVETALRAEGIMRDTYIVFSSDNGLHTGEYRLMPGKLTAYDTDIHVPLVVMGPGVPAGSVNTDITQNVDLAKTFAQLGGTWLPSDGHSLVGLLHGVKQSDWRTAALVEHHGPARAPDDPDAQSAANGNPTTYEAMRTKDFLYVSYKDGEHEFYDLRTDPYELHNVYRQLPKSTRRQLARQLRRLRHCHGSRACWAAAHVPADIGTAARRG